jgi:flagellar basal body-associated protein FliL
MSDDRKPRPQKKNPTRAISVFIVVVVLAVIGTLFFNAIREKHEFERENAQPTPASGVSPAVPAIGASH